MRVMFWLHGHPRLEIRSNPWLPIQGRDHGIWEYASRTHAIPKSVQVILEVALELVERLLIYARSSAILSHKPLNRLRL